MPSLSVQPIQAPSNESGLWRSQACIVVKHTSRLTNERRQRFGDVVAPTAVH